jgi:hypothetical protein
LKPILKLGAAVVFVFVFVIAVFAFAIPLFGQSNVGELRLKVADPDGLGVKTTVQIVSAANQYRNNLATGEEGIVSLNCVHSIFLLFRPLGSN